MVSKTAIKTGLSWFASVVLHLGVVAVALVGLPYLERPTPTPPPPIAIEFVAISAKTQQAKPKIEVEQEATEDKPQSKSAAAENVPDEPSETVPLPPKEADADVTPALEPKAKPKPKPKPRPKVSKARKLAQAIRPRSKPKPPSRFKISRIAETIDRSLKEDALREKRDDKKKLEKRKNDEEKKRALASAALQGRIATASIRDALSQKLAGCWTFPRGAKGVAKMQVVIRMSLRPDGSLLRSPQFVNAGNLNDPSRGFYRVFAESARRAVLGCAPYTDVAKILFNIGETTIDFNFSGADFAGG